MSDDERNDVETFLRQLKARGRQFTDFEVQLGHLRSVSENTGLDENLMSQAIDVVTSTDLRVSSITALIRCMIPKRRVEDNAVRKIITWCLSGLDTLSKTIPPVVFQWVLGLLNYQLVDRKTVNAFYELYFYAMLKNDQWGKQLAHLVYELTRPEDVTRRQVRRILEHNKKFAKPQKHFLALLSLFKSYKPELVPEKVPSVNVDSAWKPIPEVLRIGFDEARSREDVHETRVKDNEYFSWASVSKRKRNAEPLIPSIGYFHIGARIFKEHDSKSIFELYNYEVIGKHQLSVELPCNAISLLHNTAGFHLLTFSNLEYQSRFSCNLFYTLRRAFVLETEKFSKQDKDQLLKLTAEFCKYSQSGILILNLFMEEFFSLCAMDFTAEMLNLISWMTFTSVPDLFSCALIHVQSSFPTLSLTMKCKVVETLKNLVKNVYVQHTYFNVNPNSCSLFLQQKPLLNSLKLFVETVAEVAANLIMCGLTAHSLDSVFIYESLAFYEELILLQSKDESQRIWTVAPKAVIFSGFSSKDCTILSKTINLLLMYEEMDQQVIASNAVNDFKNELKAFRRCNNEITEIFVNDKAYDDAAVSYLEILPKQIRDELRETQLNDALNVRHHIALLPHIYTLRESGLSIASNRSATVVAMNFYPHIARYCCEPDEISSLERMEDDNN